VCPAAEDISGTYQAIANGETGGASGGPYFNLESSITFTKVNDGQYKVDDMTFGVYPLIYEDDVPEGILNVCGFTINGIEENVDQYDDPYTITGTIIEASPDVITLEWSNTYGDSGTVTLVKQ
jgi:hypothetical protein